MFASLHRIAELTESLDDSLARSGHEIRVSVPLVPCWRILRNSIQDQTHRSVIHSNFDKTPVWKRIVGDPAGKFPTSLSPEKNFEMTGSSLNPSKMDCKTSKRLKQTKKQPDPTIKGRRNLNRLR